MRRPLPLILLALILATLPLGFAQGLEGRVLTVATDALYPPFAYIDETGEVVGFERDLLSAICSELGCSVTMLPTLWEDIFEVLATGEADLVASGLTVTAARQETVDFSQPYHLFPQVLVVRAGRDIEGDNVTVGVQVNLHSEVQAAGMVGEANVRAYDTIDLAFLALVGGEVDAVLSDLALAESFLELYSGQLELSAWSVAPERIAFAFRPGDPLLEAVNLALARLQEDGTLQALADAWFNPDQPQVP